MAQTINVNMTPNLFQPALYWSQGDIGREVRINLVSNDGDSIPSGATVTMQATKPSGLGFTCAGTLADNVATFETTDVMTDEYGRYPAEIKVVSGGDTIFSANFIIVSEKNTHPEGTTDGSAETLIPELTLLIERAENAAQTAVDDAIAAADTKVNEILDNLPQEVSDLKSDFTNVQEGKLPIHLVKNSYINSSTGAFQNYNGWSRTEKIPISKYHSITYKSSVTSGYNAFYKADGTFRSQVLVSTTETTTVIPDDAYYVAFSNTNEGMASFEASFISDVENEAENASLKSIKADRLLGAAADYAAPYNDCDTFPNETIIGIIYNPVGLLANMPSKFVGGTILTLNGVVHGSTEIAQLAIGKDGTLYARHKWGSTWSAWTSNNNATSYLNFSMFPSIGVIGDSFASGAILIDPPDIWGMYPNYSWPNIVGRSYGSDINSYASSGLSTRDWLTNTSVGLQKLLADAPSSLYLLCLGINDGAIYNEDQTYLGSIADIKPDFTQNPDTFYGNYGRIFEQISAHAPNAKIIFINPPTYNALSPTYQLFTEAIEEIANHFDVPFVDSMDDEFFSSEFFQTQGKSTAHPVAMTYAGMAEAYNRLFCLCVQNNYSYFLDTH